MKSHKKEFCQWQWQIWNLYFSSWIIIIMTSCQTSTTVTKSNFFSQLPYLGDSPVWSYHIINFCSQVCLTIQVEIVYLDLFFINVEDTWRKHFSRGKQILFKWQSCWKQFRFSQTNMGKVYFTDSVWSWDVGKVY